MGIVLSLPLFELLVIAAFSFDDFASVRVLIMFDLTRLAIAFFSNCGRSCAARCGLRIEDGYDVTQAVAVFAQQIAKLFLKFDLALQTIVVFQAFKLSQLCSELLFKCAKLSEPRHMDSF